MDSYRKYNDLTLAERAQIIDDINRGSKTRKGIAKEANITVTTLHSILRNEHLIMAQVTAGNLIQNGKQVSDADIDLCAQGTSTAYEEESGEQSQIYDETSIEEFSGFAHQHFLLGGMSDEDNANGEKGHAADDDNYSNYGSDSDRYGESAGTHPYFTLDNTPISGQRRLTDVTDVEKAKVIEAVNSGLQTKKRIAEEYNISVYTLSLILKDAPEASAAHASRKRKRAPNTDDAEPGAENSNNAKAFGVGKGNWRESERQDLSFSELRRCKRITEYYA